MYICMYVYMYICIYVYMYICMRTYVCGVGLRGSHRRGLQQDGLQHQWVAPPWTCFMVEDLGFRS